MRRKLRLFVLLAVAVSLVAIFAATKMVNAASAGRTYSDVAAIPHRPVGLVLGCSKTAGHYRNSFFDNRIAAAARLFHAGKVDYLLVSGDNHTREYDESTDMKDSLIAAGVPSDRVYCDYAGFRTLDSIVRAREVFGQKEITIVSQEFHNQRAIFIASHRGLNAVGFNAAEVDAYNSFRTRCREQVARVATVVDIYLLRRQPRFLGKKIAIGQPTACLRGNNMCGVKAWPASPRVR